MVANWKRLIFSFVNTAWETYFPSPIWRTGKTPRRPEGTYLGDHTGKGKQVLGEEWTPLNTIYFLTQNSHGSVQEHRALPHLRTVSPVSQDLGITQQCHCDDMWASWGPLSNSHWNSQTVQLDFACWLREQRLTHCRNASTWELWSNWDKKN